MTPSHTTKNGKLRYRYYICCSAQKKGWHTCPSKSVPAGPIEAFVVDRIRCIGRDPDLLDEVLAQARAQVEARIAELEAEERGLEKELAAWQQGCRSPIGPVQAGRGQRRGGGTTGRPQSAD